MVQSSSGRSSFAYAALNRIVRIDRSEVAASLWSFACFFFLWCGDYILQTLRNRMWRQGGCASDPWLLSATGAAMGAVAAALDLPAARAPSAPLRARCFGG